MKLEEIAKEGYYWVSLIGFPQREVVQIRKNRKTFPGQPGRWYLGFGAKKCLVGGKEGYVGDKLEDYENFNGPIKEEEEHHEQGIEETTHGG